MLLHFHPLSRKVAWFCGHQSWCYDVHTHWFLTTQLYLKIYCRNAPSLSHMISTVSVFFFESPTLLPHSQLRPLSSIQPHWLIDFQPKGHRETRNEVGYLCLAEHLVWFEPETFRFDLNHLNRNPTLTYFKWFKLSIGKD